MTQDPMFIQKQDTSTSQKEESFPVTEQNDLATTDKGKNRYNVAYCPETPEFDLAEIEKWVLENLENDESSENRETAENDNWRWLRNSNTRCPQFPTIDLPYPGFPLEDIE